MNKISMVIGSWGSYTECNERALGSKWLDFDDYEDWDDIVEELKKEGFELDGIDEELFVQDIEGIPANLNWDCVYPKTIFETIKESGVLDSDYKYKEFEAYLEVRSYEEFEELVEKHGDDWDMDIHIYEGMDWSDYGEELFDSCYPNYDDHIRQFIDFEEYGKYMGDYYAQEYSDGIIEIA